MAFSSGITNIDTETTVLTDAVKIHSPPPGTNFSEAEMELWNYIMRARLYRRWTNSDLYLAVKVVRLDTRIQKGYERLQEIEEDGGDIFEHRSEAQLYYQHLMKAETSLLVAIRAIGLTRSPTPSPDPERNDEDKRSAAFLQALADVRGLSDGTSPGAQPPPFLAIN